MARYTRRHQTAYNRAGFTLIELVLVLVVALTMVTVSLRVYSSARDSAKETQTLVEVNLIHGVIETLYAAQHQYNGLTTSQIISALPNSMVNQDHSAVVNPYGGQIAIDTSADALSYTVLFTRLPQRTCVLLGTVNLGHSMTQVTLNDGEAAITPLSLTAAEAQCTSPASNTVGLIFQ